MQKKKSLDRGKSMKTVGTVFLAMYLLLSSRMGLTEEKESVSREEESSADKMVITREDIEKLNVHGIIELLNQLPGVSATDSGISFRGASATGILVLLNGRPLNNPADAHRGVDWNIVSLHEIDRIEVNKGVGSVVYGDNTSGGTISITTRKVSDGGGGSIEAAFGSFNSQLYDLNLRRKIGSLGMGLSTGLEESDGFRQNDHSSSKRIGTRISHDIDREKIMSLSFDYSKQDDESPGKSYAPTPRAESHDETLGSTLLLPIGRVKSATTYSSFEKNFQDPDKHLKTNLQSWVANEELTTALSPKPVGMINLGACFETAHAEGTSVASRKERKYALYTVKEVRFESVPLKADLGLRWSGYSEFPSAVYPQLQLKYEHPAVAVWLSVNRSNNTPSFYQRYYESTFSKPNPDLGMEKALNYSLGFSSQIIDALEGNLSFFWNTIDDRITYIKRSDGFGTYVNLGSVTQKGIEAASTGNFHRFLQVKCSYTFVLAEDDETGKQLTYTAKHKGNFDLYLKPLDRLSLGLTSRYTSKKFTKADNSEYVGSYFVVDAKADCAFEKVNLFLKLTNILDRDYEIGDGYPGEPLACTAGIKYGF